MKYMKLVLTVVMMANLLSFSLNSTAEEGTFKVSVISEDVTVDYDGYVEKAETYGSGLSYVSESGIVLSLSQTRGETNSEDSNGDDVDTQITRIFLGGVTRPSPDWKNEVGISYGDIDFDTLYGTVSVKQYRLGMQGYYTFTSGVDGIIGANYVYSDFEEYDTSETSFELLVGLDVSLFDVIGAKVIYSKSEATKDEQVNLSLSYQF